VDPALRLGSQNTCSNRNESPPTLAYNNLPAYCAAAVIESRGSRGTCCRTPRQEAQSFKLRPVLVQLNHRFRFSRLTSLRHCFYRPCQQNLFKQ
jgi:hypothetical protein